MIINSDILYKWGHFFSEQFSQLAFCRYGQNSYLIFFNRRKISLKKESKKKYGLKWNPSYKIIPKKRELENPDKRRLSIL